ncbi:MAG TPA: endonuclease/exonuclease/phosphatase family protein [Actinomycetota bacterium]|nr:endonuclease/exonuclease/phosphatase family protein [Actinomycetota bacterium]
MRLGRLAAAYSVGVLGWIAGRRTRLQNWPPFELLDLFGWALYLPLPLLATSAAVKRDRRAVAPLALVAAAFAAEYGHRYIPRSAPQAPPGAEVLRVAGANLWLRNRQPDAVAEMVEALAPDVIAFHELQSWMEEWLVARIGHLYPHRVSHAGPGSWGHGVFSKHPLTPREHAVGPDLSYQEVDIHLPDADLSLLSVHPDTPGTGPSDFDTSKQERALDEILDRIRAAPHPVVAVGDFNISDRHRFHRRLTEPLGDAFAAGGRGVGFTWRDPVPVIRIDHVLHDRRLTPLTAWTGRIPGSDHRYVCAEIAVPPGARTVTLNP